jgi:membrane protein DedA with SNARE-associated domain
VHHHLLPHPFGTTGYLAIILVVAIESLGIPLPGETALLAGAALAAAGRLSLVGVIVAAAGGAILGSAAGYTIGRIGGTPFVTRYGQRLGLTPARLARMNDFFARHGPEAVFFGRFIAFLRTWAAILAGTAEMPIGVFAFYATLGAIVWSVLFGLVGYFFGRVLPAVEHEVRIVTLCLLGVVVVGWGIYYIRKRMKRGPAAASGISTGTGPGPPA